MSKLYFKYGTMNSSKSANLLMTKHNYEEEGMLVALLKPSTDTREGHDVISSRVGLSSPCTTFAPDEHMTDVMMRSCDSRIPDVILVDEAQFATPRQIEELYEISFKLPVICFGLKTDSHTKMFPGSQRLFELAESISEIKTICRCGAKATINARINAEGKVVMNAPQVDIGGNEKYRPMCKRCFVAGGGTFFYD